MSRLVVWIALLGTAVSAAAQVRVYFRDGRTYYVRPKTDPAYNDRGIGHPPRGTNPRIWYAYDPYLIRFSGELGVDPVMAKAILWAESGGKWRATSSKNARGLMQLLDHTARTVGGYRNPRGLGAYDPIENIQDGVRYLAILQQKFQGNLIKIAAAYNAGPANVEAFNGIPPFPETKAYVPRVLALWDAINAGR